MNKVEQLVKEVEAKGHDVWIGGRASPQTIRELGKKLGVELPASLEAFLGQYGTMSIGDDVISGIIDDQPLAMRSGGIYGDTLIMRRDSPEMPASLWVIQKHEDGAYCMDVARPTTGGEFAIVNFGSFADSHFMNAGSWAVAASVAMDKKRKMVIRIGRSSSCRMISIVAQRTIECSP